MPGDAFQRAMRGVLPLAALCAGVLLLIIIACAIDVSS